MQTVYNGADGTYVFEAISYTEPGDHVYTIREVNEGKTGITYDDTVHTVTVKVVDDGEGNLVARINDVAVTEKKDLDFTNHYAPVGFTFVNLSGTKTLVGRDLKAGEFTFFLIDEAGNIIDTVKNAADGTFTFADRNDDCIQESNVELAAQGVKNGTHQQCAEKTLCHGAHSVDAVAFS